MQKARLPDECAWNLHPGPADLSLFPPPPKAKSSVSVTCVLSNKNEQDFRPPWVPRAAAAGGAAEAVESKSRFRAFCSFALWEGLRVLRCVSTRVSLALASDEKRPGTTRERIRRAGVAENVQGSAAQRNKKKCNQG